MKLKLREIEIFYLQELFAASKEPLKASENKYKFTFSKNTEALELEKRANQLMLKFIKQTIDIEKSFESEEKEAFYLTINNNIKFATAKKILGYDINPKKVFNTIIKERDKTLSKFLKLKGAGKKDYILVSLMLTKGPLHMHHYIASLEVVYYYDIL